MDGFKGTIESQHSHNSKNTRETNMQHGRKKVSMKFINCRLRPRTSLYMDGIFDFITSVYKNLINVAGVPFKKKTKSVIKFSSQ